MIPPWGNLFIELLKATSLVSLITISDLAFQAQQMNPTTFRTLEIFSIVLVFYLAIATLITIAMRTLEERVAQRPRAGTLMTDVLGLGLRLGDPAAPREGVARHDRGDDSRLRDRRGARPRLAIGGCRARHGSACRLAGFIEFIRSTPLLIQIFFIYFVFPEFGLVLDAMTAGVLALGLHYAHLLLRSLPGRARQRPARPVGGVDRAQPDGYHTFRDVIIPQAIPPVVPALGNYLVALFKDTPLLSAIGVLELMQTAKIVGSDTFRYIEPITMVGAVLPAVQPRRGGADQAGRACI